MTANPAPVFAAGHIVKARPPGKGPRLGRILRENPDGSFDFVTFTNVTRDKGNRPKAHSDVGKTRVLRAEHLEPATLAEKTTVETYEESDAFKARRAEAAALSGRHRRRRQR